jgi:hypothetical protein
MQFCNLFTFKFSASILAFCALLSGCSSGRIEQSRLIQGNEVEEIHVSRHIQNIPCLEPTPNIPEITDDRRNTVFIHPGLLLLGLNWDHSLAVEAGDILKSERLSGRIIELRDREVAPIFEHASTDPGTQFIGIHYSMGGRPDLIGASLEAIKKAALIRGTPLRYHAILVDPFSISDIENHVDINRPEMGYLFILLSSEFSFLRPSIRDFPPSFLKSGKVFFINAEDFGESWGHFGMLYDLREQHFNNPQHIGGRKMRALFQAMVAMAFNKHDVFSPEPKLVCNGQIPIAQFNDAEQVLMGSSWRKP